MVRWRRERRVIGGRSWFYGAACGGFLGWTGPRLGRAWYAVLRLVLRLLIWQLLDVTRSRRACARAAPTLLRAATPAHEVPFVYCCEKKVIWEGVGRVRKGCMVLHTGLRAFGLKVTRGRMRDTVPDVSMLTGIAY